MKNYPPGTKFVGFLFDANGWHSEGEPLFSVEEAYKFCLDHWRLTDEVRITDPTEEFTELQAQGGELICPMPDGSLKRMPLPELERAIKAEGGFQAAANPIDDDVEEVGGDAAM